MDLIFVKNKIYFVYLPFIYRRFLISNLKLDIKFIHIIYLLFCELKQDNIGRRGGGKYFIFPSWCVGTKYMFINQI